MGFVRSLVVFLVPAHDSHVGVFYSGYATARTFWASLETWLLQVVRRGVGVLGFDVREAPASL